MNQYMRKMFKKYNKNKFVSFICILLLMMILYGLILDEYIALVGFVLFATYAIYRVITKKRGELGKGEIGPIRKEIKDACFKRQRGLCGWVGCRERKYLKLHHIIPRNMGGDNRMSNLIYLCPNHHDAAHDTGNGKATYSAVPKYLRIHKYK